MTARTMVLTHDDPNVSQERQLRVCMNFIGQTRDLTFAGLLRPGSSAADVAAAVAAGVGEVVLAAYRNPAVDLTDEVTAAGGRVHYVHAPRGGRLTVRYVIARLSTKLDLTPQEIAELLDADLAEVRDHLRRSGTPTPRRER